MEFLNAFGAFIIGVVSLLIGIVIGGTVADNRTKEKRQKAQKDPKEGITSAEAFLEGFSDGYFELNSREFEFSKASFGMRYTDGYYAGRDKRSAETDIELDNSREKPGL